MKVVKVLWVDSCNSNMNWTVTEDIEIELMYINSFGIVVKDTDEFLAIAQNYGDNPEQYSNITTIPKGCIKEVFVIHEDNVYEDEQNPVEWSEEDEEIRKSIIDIIERRRMSSIGSESAICENQIDFLKSLSPKKQWKPSLQQINALSVAVKHGQTDEPDALEELLEQLKGL